jgi:hypothetical protein
VRRRRPNIFLPVLVAQPVLLGKTWGAPHPQLHRPAPPKVLPDKAPRATTRPLLTTERAVVHAVPDPSAHRSAFRSWPHESEPAVSPQHVLEPELGYGKAVYHVLRAIRGIYAQPWALLDYQEVFRLLDEGFLLPAASKTAHHLLKESAREFLSSHMTEHDDDL